MTTFVFRLYVYDLRIHYRMAYINFVTTFLMPGGRYNTLMFIILRIDPYFYKVRLAFIRNTAHVYVGCHALYPSLGIKVTPNVMPNVIEISDGA